MSVSTSLNRLGRNKKQNTSGYACVGVRKSPGQVFAYKSDIHTESDYPSYYLKQCVSVFRCSDTSVMFMKQNTITEHVYNSYFVSRAVANSVFNCSSIKSITDSECNMMIIGGGDYGFQPIADCPQLHTVQIIYSTGSSTTGCVMFKNCPNLRNALFSELVASLYDLSGAPLSYESLISFIHALSTTDTGSYTITFYDGELTADQITDITQKIEAKGYVSSPTSTLLTS